MSRIETDKVILPHLSVSTEERSGNLIEECVARGTAHLRTHVDVDLESGLSKLDGVLAARERYRDRASVQIVAFPQSGVMRCPGVLDLLDAAVRSGADLVGGIDPLEIDRDPKGQLDGIFAIADRHGVGLDIHLHEPGEMGLFNVYEICARTRTLGLRGKVTISHGVKRHVDLRDKATRRFYLGDSLTKRVQQLSLRRSSGKQVDDLLNGFVGAVICGFQFTVWLVTGDGAVVEAAVGERTAEPLVEEEKEQRDLDAFRGEAVGVAGSIPLQQAVTFEFAQVVAQLVDAVASVGEMEGGDNDLMDLLGGPAADVAATMQEDFEQADDARVMELDAGIADRADGDGEGETLQQREVDMDVEPLRLEAGEAICDGLEPLTHGMEMIQSLPEMEIGEVV